MVVFSNCFFRYFCCVFSQYPSHVATSACTNHKKSFVSETIGHTCSDSDMEYIQNYILNNRQQIIDYLSNMLEKSNIIHKHGFYYNMDILHERNDIHEGKLVTGSFAAKCIVERNNENDVELSKHFIYSSINEMWSELIKYRNGEEQTKAMMVKERDRLVDILHKYNQNNTITNVYYVAPKVEDNPHVYSPGWHGFITIEDKETHDVLFCMVLPANAGGIILNPHVFIDVYLANKLSLEIRISPLSCKDCMYTHIVNELPVKDDDEWSFIMHGTRCNPDINQINNNPNYITVTSKLRRATDDEMNEYFGSIIPLEISVFLDKIRKGAQMLDMYREYNRHMDIGQLMNGVDLDNKIELKDYIEGYLLDLYIQHANSNNNLWVKKPRSSTINVINTVCPMGNNHVPK